MLSRAKDIVRSLMLVELLKGMRLTGKHMFARAITVPAAATSSTMTVVASARNAANAQIATAQRTFAIVRALKVSPTLLGLARGATGTIRLSLEQPAAEDLAINVSSANSAVATVASASVVLPAGQTTIDVQVTACATCPLDPPSRVGAAVRTGLIWRMVQ